MFRVRVFRVSLLRFRFGVWVFEVQGCMFGVQRFGIVVSGFEVFGVRGLAFGVWCFAFGVRGFELGVWGFHGSKFRGSGFRGSKFRGSGLGFRFGVLGFSQMGVFEVWGFRFRVPGFAVLGVGFGVSGLGFRGYAFGIRGFRGLGLRVSRSGF